MNIINNLEGMYAKPKNHPVTSLNPSPWLIVELKIESHPELEWAIWIRGEKSCWFRLDQCIILNKNECGKSFICERQ